MSEITTNEINDESALDAELEQSINQVKAGQVLDEKSTDETTETETTEKNEPVTEGETPGDSQKEAEATEETEFRTPNKGKYESDEAYEKRIELFDLVKRRKAATTPEAKAEFSKQISRTKNELKILGSEEKITHHTNDATIKEEDEDPTTKADKERLKEIGGATKEDISEIIRAERMEQEVKSTLNSFVEKSPQLKDEDVREVFFDFVDANYVWQNKTGRDLVAVLEMAKEAMFRPAETIQERVLKGADVQGKVNAMQFPGGSTAQTTYSPEIKASLEELKATGMSEEKALELLSE